MFSLVPPLHMSNVLPQIFQVNLFPLAEWFFPFSIPLSVHISFPTFYIYSAKQLEISILKKVFPLCDADLSITFKVFPYRLIIHPFIRVQYPTFALNLQSLINSCSLEIESTSHFLLHCHHSSNIRLTLSNSITDVFGSITSLSDDTLVKILLFGNQDTLTRRTHV